MYFCGLRAGRGGSSWIWLNILKDPKLSLIYQIKGDDSLGIPMEDLVFPNMWHHICLTIDNASGAVNAVLVSNLVFLFLNLLDNQYVFKSRMETSWQNKTVQ